MGIALGEGYGGQQLKQWLISLKSNAQNVANS